MKPNSYKKSKEEIINSSLVHDGKDPEGLSFSKGIVIVSYILFFGIVFYYLGLVTNVISIFKNGEASTISSLGSSLSWASGSLSVVVTSSASLPVTSTVWYLKKTHLSYATKVQGDVGKSMAGVELGYVRGCYEMKKEFNLSDQDVEKMVNSSRIHQMTNSLYQDVTQTARTGVSEGTATIRKEV